MKILILEFHNMNLIYFWIIQWDTAVLVDDIWIINSIAFHFIGKTVFTGTFSFDVIRLIMFVKNSNQYTIVQCVLLTTMK